MAGQLKYDVQAIGIDAVITSSRGAIAPASQQPAVSHILDHRTTLKGTRMLAMDGMDGRDLGVMVDLYFSETSGQVEGYEVSGGYLPTLELQGGVGRCPPKALRRLARALLPSALGRSVRLLLLPLQSAPARLGLLLAYLPG